jgi:deazaflavin-dependent oxidoreductase (nitroreductase family)
MTTPVPALADSHRPTGTDAPSPRFGGVLWRLARLTSRATLPFAGKRWNPFFAVVHHRGRRSGRPYDTPVAARRTGDGFVISLAFGAHVDWYRNIVAADGCTIRWRGADYPVGGPEAIDPAAGRLPFHPVQRVLLGLAGIDGYVRLRDATPDPAST